MNCILRSWIISCQTWASCCMSNFGRFFIKTFSTSLLKNLHWKFTKQNYRFKTMTMFHMQQLKFLSVKIFWKLPTSVHLELLCNFRMNINKFAIKLLYWIELHAAAWKFFMLKGFLRIQAHLKIIKMEIIEFPLSCPIIRSDYNNNR